MNRKHNPFMRCGEFRRVRDLGQDYASALYKAYCVNGMLVMDGLSLIFQNVHTLLFIKENCALDFDTDSPVFLYQTRRARTSQVQAQEPVQVESVHDLPITAIMV